MSVSHKHDPNLFWRLVDKSGTCWIWNGYVNPQGYGRIKIQKRATLAHRRAWEITHGPIADPGLCVCHHCDNRRCVNPAHLFLGTRLDNNKDRSRKGRTRSGPVKPYRARAEAEAIGIRPPNGSIRAAHDETRRGSQLSCEHGIGSEVMNMLRRR